MHDYINSLKREKKDNEILSFRDIYFVCFLDYHTIEIHGTKLHRFYKTINENKQEITKQLQEFDQELQVKSVHHAILTLEAWKSIGHMVAVPTIEYPPMSTELIKNKALSLYADIKRGGNH